MLSKYLISFITYSVLALAIFPAYGQSNSTSEITFTCEDDRGIPVTVAKNNQGEMQTIFNWKLDVFPDFFDPLEICDRVSQKLNNYAAEGHDLSLFILQPNEQAGLPTICATKTGVSCDLVLFTLAPTEEPFVAACDTLMAILNQEVNRPIKETNRDNQQKLYFSISLFQNE